jgi:hypothetical protein
MANSQLNHQFHPVSHRHQRLGITLGVIDRVVGVVGQKRGYVASLRAQASQQGKHRHRLAQNGHMWPISHPTFS